MIPGEKEWAIIFSKNSTSWGSYSYDQKEDALRVTAEPEQAPSQEWLSYQIEPAATGSATIALRWEKLKVPFRVEIDVPATVLRKAREEYLRGLARFGWQGWYQAANYCAMQKVDLDEAISWIDRSIQMNKNFTNLWVKADLLMQTGKKDQAGKMKEEALALANEATVNTAGYQYLGAGRVAEAIELFKINAEKYPESWNVYDSLAEGYATQGEKAKAIEFYTKALSKVTDETQKARIRQAISVLGGQ
jgi:tetratricopeptide (TPR) repeat protein